MNNLLDEYDRIVRPIQDRMIRAIWRIVQDAEDAMQNALAITRTRWERVRGHIRPQAQIMKICIDAAYDVLRR
jgi:hypothetical protein